MERVAPLVRLRAALPHRNNTFLSSFISRLAIGLTLGAVMATIVVIVGARLLHFGTHPNPFAPYEAILPGVTRGIIARFNCDETKEIGTGTTTCSIHPEKDAVFRLIMISADDDGIEQLLFFSDELEFEALNERWGAPQLIQRILNHQGFKMTWDCGSYTVTAVLPGPFGSPRDTLVRVMSNEGI